MTDNMVERVAKALYLEWITSQLDDEYVEWDKLPDKETWRIRARAAIEAMRKSTDDMIRSAASAWQKSNPGDNPEIPSIWRAMLSAALNQGQTK